MSPPVMEIFTHRDLSAQQARAITEKIQSSMGDLMELVVKAHLGRAWLALGYGSWPEYIKGEFNHAPLSLPRAERKAVSVLLRRQGMSPKAIGGALGVTDQTIRDDLAGSKNLEGEPIPVIGLDGKTYTNREPKPDIVDAEIVDLPPDPEQSAPNKKIACPTCGGTGRITK